MTDIRGVCPIIATPFTETGNVDLKSLESLIEFLIDGGCHGVTLFGVAGEFYKLSDDERERMIEAAVSVIEESETPLISALTDQSVEVAVDRSRAAEAAGVDALMVLPPSMLAPSAEDQYQHLKQIGEAVDIPIMIQYAPETAGVATDIGMFERLSSEVENVRHYKIESRPPGRDITRLLNSGESPVEVLVGNAGKHMIEALDRGATGVIPGSSMHEIYVEIYESYTAGRRAEAVSLYDDLVPMLNQLHQTPSMLIHYEKEILSRRGVIDSPYCRSPRYQPDEYYDRLFEEYYEKIREYLPNRQT